MNSAPLVMYHLVVLKKLLGPLVIFLVMTGLFWLGRDSALAIKFVDEDDNFVGGYAVAQGEKLYQDYFSHHQPAAYGLSSLVQRVIPAESLFLLVKRHREFIALWSIAWAVFLVARFGPALIPGILIFELVKPVFLGNLFLAENLVVYPLIYLILLTATGTLMSRKEQVWVGLVGTVAALSLATSWPVTGLVFGWQLAKKQIKFWLLALGGILGILPILTYVDLIGYWAKAILVNWRYYIPGHTQFLDNSLVARLVGPVAGLGQNSVWLPISLAWILYLIGTAVLWPKQKSLTVFYLAALYLANIRSVEIGETYYTGFHMIPALGLVTIGTAMIWSKLQLGKVIAWGLVMLMAWKSGNYFLETRNIDSDYYVNYSWIFDAGEIIQIVKADDDNLQVVGDEMLVNWAGQIKRASPYAFYYPWMESVPGIQQDWRHIMNSRPTFIYLEDSSPDWVSTQGYTQIVKFGSPLNLWVREEKLVNLNQKQRQQLEYFGVDTPAIDEN